jgi:hypothetical protein
VLGKNIFNVLESLINSSLDNKGTDKHFFLFDHIRLQSVEGSDVKDISVMQEEDK